MATEKTYTTRSRCFQIPYNDFDVINEIHATSGRYTLQVGHQAIDARDQDKNGQHQVYFLGKTDMNLWVYRYNLGCNTSIIKGDDEEVTYTVKGRVYESVLHLIAMEEMLANNETEFTKRPFYTSDMKQFLTYGRESPIVESEIQKLLGRKIEVPVVAFGMLNYLYYVDGFAALRFWFNTDK